nr:MAG TPA: hypothetical protein [Caudoviricetes sp.]
MQPGRKMDRWRERGSRKPLNPHRACFRRQVGWNNHF